MMYSPAGLHNLTDVALSELRESFRTDTGGTDAEFTVTEKYYESVSEEMTRRRDARYAAQYITVYGLDDDGAPTAYVKTGDDTCKSLAIMYEHAAYGFDGNAHTPVKVHALNDDASLTELTVRYDNDQSHTDWGSEMIYDFYDIVNPAGAVILSFWVRIDGRA